MKRTEQFQHSREYFIEKWLSEEQRQKESPENFPVLAYQNCYRSIRHAKVVSRNTLCKWFGVRGNILPKREQILRLAFAAQFTVEELQEYLQEGILEPGIQINDYREIIFMYGLEHTCSYQDCLDMITVFERCVNQDTVLQQRTHTEQLQELYKASHSLKPEEFLVWMCDHAEYFKGYSRVALKYFTDLKTEIVEYVSEAARIELRQHLEEFHFSAWVKENGLEKVEKEDIQRFVRNISRRKEGYISAAEKDEIGRLMRTAYLRKHTNAELLKEVYPLPAKNMSTLAMDQKKISQILRIAEHKEKEIKLSWALSCLGGIKDKDAACPKGIRILIERYQLTTKPRALVTVEAAEKCLGKCIKDQRQLCHLIQREDLLPLIHYVAQLRYEKENKGYHMNEARQVFTDLADEILSDCQMAVMKEGYRLDDMFLSSYRENEMYSFADLMEDTVLDWGTEGRI